MSVNYVEYAIHQYHYKNKSNKTEQRIKNLRYYYNDNPSNAAEYAYAKMRNLIEANDIPLIKFAKIINITRQGVNYWEKSETGMSVYHIQKICNYFNITITDFFKDQYKIKQIASDIKDMYIATDGSVFFDKCECKKYQRSINKNLRY